MAVQDVVPLPINVEIMIKGPKNMFNRGFKWLLHNTVIKFDHSPSRRGELSEVSVVEDVLCHLPLPLSAV